MNYAIQSVFPTVTTSVLGADAVAIEGDVTGAVDSPTFGGRTLVACVQISGAWSGAVLMWCTGEFASLAVKAMFDVGDGADEERDAVGEIANMVAGNLKATLPSPSRLSLPIVASGHGFGLDVRHSRPIERVEFLVDEEHHVVVTLVREEPRGELSCSTT
jgi:chemotaxis protein CheX